MLGSHCAALAHFPLLVKYIDAREGLSIQVHPNDEYSAKHEGQWGKTEMWYILDADRSHTCSSDRSIQSQKRNSLKA